MDAVKQLLEENAQLEALLGAAQSRIEELEEQLRHKTAATALAVAEAHLQRISA